MSTLSTESRWHADWEQGRRAHAGVSLSLADFSAHLDAVAGSASPLRHAADLYLACACVRALPAALAAFDGLLTDVPAWVRYVNSSHDFADEVRQRLREHLLVSSGARPRIAEYNGAGPLRGWLRVAAARTALNLRRNVEDRHAVALDALEHEEATLGALRAEPELQMFCRGHQETLRRAMRDAFVWLSREERTALRLQYAAGMTTEQIATALRVHRATVVRRLSQARARLYGEVRRLLGERLRLSPPEVDSFIGALREGGLELSLGCLLRTLQSEG